MSNQLAWASLNTPTMDNTNAAEINPLFTPTVGVPQAIINSFVDYPIGSGNETNPPVVTQATLVGDAPTANYFITAQPGLWTGNSFNTPYYYMGLLISNKPLTLYQSVSDNGLFGYSCGFESFNGTTHTIPHKLSQQPNIVLIQPTFTYGNSAYSIYPNDVKWGMETQTNSAEIIFTRSTSAPNYPFYWIALYGQSTLFTSGLFTPTSTGILTFNHNLVDKNNNPLAPGWACIQANSTSIGGVYGLYNSVNNGGLAGGFDSRQLVAYVQQNVLYNWVAMAPMYNYFSPSFPVF